MGLPIYSYRPSRGITVDRTKRKVIIRGTMDMYGSAASGARAHSAQHAINTNWTKHFIGGYSINCAISITFRTTPRAHVTPIRAEPSTYDSQVTGVWGNYKMYLNPANSHAFTWTAAHEFGHIIGMKDRYSESIWSRIKGKLGYKRDGTKPHRGYEGNMMGEVGGTVEQKNIDDLKKENAPSQYWINDDDSVRLWVKRHSLTQITRLSTADKLSMLATLMAWWISAEDIKAIVKICQSVRSKVEANTIRRKIYLPSFQSLGQRMKVQIAFSKMPK